MSEMDQGNGGLHTPLPWAHLNRYICGEHPTIPQCVQHIAGIVVTNNDGETAAANAAFIVRAANNHYQLVKALLRLDTLFDFSDEDIGEVWRFDDLSEIQAAFKEARAALSAAKGET